MSDTTQFDVAPVGSPSRRRLDGLLALLCVSIVGAAVLLLLQEPGRALIWLGAAMFLPCVVLLTRALPTLANCAPDLRQSLLRSLLGAGVLILVPLLLRLALGYGWLDIGGVQRSTGVLLGGGLMVAASYLPQKLLPFVRAHFDLSVAGRLTRQIGGGLMLAGFGYAFIWLTAPLLQAQLWAAVILLVGLTLTGLRCLVSLKH